MINCTFLICSTGQFHYVPLDCPNMFIWMVSICSTGLSQYVPLDGLKFPSGLSQYVPLDGLNMFNWMVSV